MVTGLLLTLTGCWGRHELNDLAIVLGLGIDKAGDEIKVTAQVVIPSGVSSNQNKISAAPVTVFNATAPTLFEAIRKLTVSSPRIAFLSHIRVLVFGEQFARENGIGKMLDGMMRDPRVRPDYYVTVARRTTAESVLSVLSMLEKIPADKLYKSLDASATTWAPTTTVNADRLMEDMIGSGHSAVVPGVEIRGNPQGINSNNNLTGVKPAAQLVMNGLGVFRKDKLIGWLSEVESKGFNYIRDQVDSTMGHIRCEEDKGYIALNSLRSNTKIKTTMNAQSKPQFHVKVETVSVIASVECKQRIGSLKAITAMEKKGSEQTNKLMREAVNTVFRKYKVDIFGFGQELERKYPKQWAKLKDSWEEHLKDLNIQYDTKFMIKRVGTLDDSFLKQIKE